MKQQFEVSYHSSTSDRTIGASDTGDNVYVKTIGAYRLVQIEVALASIGHWTEVSLAFWAWMHHPHQLKPTYLGSLLLTLLPRYDATSVATYTIVTGQNRHSLLVRASDRSSPSASVVMDNSESSIARMQQSISALVGRRPLLLQPTAHLLRIVQQRWTSYTASGRCSFNVHLML